MSAALGDGGQGATKVAEGFGHPGIRAWRPRAFRFTLGNDQGEMPGQIRGAEGQQLVAEQLFGPGQRVWNTDLIGG